MFKIEKMRGLEMKLISVRQETRHCHSEPFTSFRTGSAKNETICHPERERRISRFFVASLLRMTWRRAVSGWTLMSNQGFTILEVLIAITILAFGLLAIATMQGSSIKGNSLAIGITEGITLAQDKAEELSRLAYDDALLTDTTDDGGDTTNQDANQNGIDEDNEGTVVDDILNFGLNQTGGGADNTENMGRYTIHWNIAVNQPLNNVKTIRVIVLWSDRGAAKRASVDCMKMDVI